MSIESRPCLQYSIKLHFRSGGRNFGCRLQIGSRFAKNRPFVEAVSLSHPSQFPYPTFLCVENATAPRVASNCWMHSQSASPSVIQASMVPDALRLADTPYSAACQGTPGALVMVQEAVAQPTFSSDVISTTTGAIWAIPANLPSR